jgi:hypothetical protein
LRIVHLDVTDGFVDQPYLYRFIRGGSARYGVPFFYWLANVAEGSFASISRPTANVGYADMAAPHRELSQCANRVIAALLQ